MGNLIGNSRIYNIHAENEVAEILSHFSPGFIEGFIREKLNNRLAYAVIEPVNDVEALEKNFRQIIDCYPEEQQRIWNIKMSTYITIINEILKTYKLAFSQEYESISGYYMEAYLLYDFLVSRYKANAVEFFSTVIMQNSDEIYKYLKMDEKKDATVYAKKFFTNDVKLGILLNNIGSVISVISQMDYGIDDILRTVYTRDNYELMLNFISDPGDFYKDFYIGLLNSYAGAPIITDIRIAIQQKYIQNNGAPQTPINSMMEDK